MTGLRRVIFFSIVWVFSISCSVAMGRDTRSLAVPDGKVYTDIKRNLIIGRRGILTCRFNKDPLAVYWLKGKVPEEAQYQVIWHAGSKSGPRYEDGTYDMDSNYSLIIKNVMDSDKGRYICRVSNHRGILIYNSTDVTLFSHGLETKAHVTLEKGISGLIPCKLNIRQKTVSWKKGSTNSTSVHLISVNQYHNHFWGPGYEGGRFNITTDFSLHITNVDLEDRGEYYCEVLEAVTYAFFMGVTSVSVIAQPMKPFPSIEGCSTTEYYSNCVFIIDSPETITCEVNGYYPYIGLYFKLGTEEVKTLQTQTWNNTDGTKNKSVSIVGHISESVYTCIAFEIPGIDGNRSTSVRLFREDGSHDHVIPVALVVPLALIATGLTLTVLHKTGKVNCTSKPGNEDPLSYVELWKLVELVFEHNEVTNLNYVIEALCVNVGTISGTKTKEYYYRELCEWKSKCASNIQKSTFYDTVYDKSLEKSLHDLKEFRGAVSTKVSLLKLEYLLREIEDQENIVKFLESLGICPSASMRNEKTSSATFFQEALDELGKWRKWDRNLNPVVILSSALEKLNEKSASSFFLVWHDPLSYAELWKLVELVFKHNEVTNLNYVIEALCVNVGTISGTKTKEYYYRELCEWKSKCASNIQKSTFYDTVYDKSLEKSLHDLKDFREAGSTRASLSDLEHILREIAERENIVKFLKSLWIDPSPCMRNEKTSSATFFQVALEKLDKWMKLDRDINPIVILSSTLEKRNQKCANNFFLVPDEKKEQNLQVEEIEEYTREFSRGHCDKLAKYISHGKTVNNVLRENNEVLFNSEKMLHDWWKEQECSYYRRRCKLDVAVILQAKLLVDTKLLSPQTRPVNQHIGLTDRELRLIADSLNTNGKRQVCEHLELSSISGSEDGVEFYDALRDWRQSNKGELSTMYGEIISAFKLQYSFGDDQWPSDDELKLIALYLDHKYTAHVREHLELTNLSDMSGSKDINDMFAALCAWRQSDKYDFTTMYRKLVSALRDTNISGLLSPLRSNAVHKVEYVEIAFSLLMTDISPLAKYLGIHETKLLLYRPTFNLPHVKKGTIELVSTLISSFDKNKERGALCRRLKELGFPPSIQLNMIAHQMSYGELSAIFTSPTTCKTSADDEKEAPQLEPQEGDHLLTEAEIQVVDKTTAPLEPKVTKAAELTKGFSRIKNILRSNSSKQSPDTTQQEKKPKEADTFRGKSREKTSSDSAIPMEPIVVQSVESSPEVTERATSSNETIVNIEPGAITSDVSLQLSEIKKTLNLSDEDVRSWVDGNLDEFTLFQIWKAKTRFSAITERAAVMKGLQDSGKDELARSVIEGKFTPEEISLSFVKHVIQTAKTNSQLEELAASLDLKKEFIESKSSVDAISEIIQKRLVISMKGSENIPGDRSGASKNSKKDKDVKSQMGQIQVHKPVIQADKLVEYGFLDLASELLIIYQQ